MFDLFRELIALPLKLILLVMGLLKTPASLGLLNLTYRISGTETDLTNYLHNYYRRNPVEARNESARLLEKVRSAYAAVIILNLDYHFIHDDTWVHDRLTLLAARPLKHDHMLDYIRLRLEKDPDRIMELSRHMNERRDYPGYVSILIQYNLAINHLKNREVEQARQIVNRSLQVAENISMRTLAIAVSLAGGKDDVERQLQLIPDKPPGNRIATESLANFFAGNIPRAKLLLERCPTDCLLNFRFQEELSTFISDILASREDQPAAHPAMEENNG